MNKLIRESIWLYLQQGEPQLGGNAQGLKVLVVDVSKVVQNQSTGPKNLTCPAQTWKKKQMKIIHSL